MSAARASKKSTTTKKSTAAAKTAAKRATAKQAAPKKASPKKASAKGKSPTKAAAKKATRKQTAGTTKKSAAKKKAVAKKSVAKKSVTKKAAAKKSAPAAKAKKTEKETSTTVPAKGKAATKAAPAPKPKKLPKHLTDKDWLNAQRKLLRAERLKYTHSAETLAAGAQALMDDRDPGDVQFDEESGEGDTLAVERDRDLALSGLAREKVDEIDAALERLAKNTYGQCISGDDFIPKDRLEALPMAAKCVQHQTSMF